MKEPTQARKSSMDETKRRHKRRKKDRTTEIVSTPASSTTGRVVKATPTSAQSQFKEGDLSGKKSAQPTRLNKKNAVAKAVANTAELSASLKQTRQSLPIYAYKQALMEAFVQNRVLIVVGETGSGKTTQLPQYILETLELKAKTKTSQAYANVPSRKTKRIAITQPRRVACTSVCARVAEEMGVSVGDKVGYSIRFDDRTSSRTRLKFVTDGMLLREAMMSATLDSYEVIILDEAHERTVQTDLLFGIVKNALAKRKDLHVVVMSATLNVDLFSSFFEEAYPIMIPGRTFPIQMKYTKDPQTDYVDSSFVTILQIHLKEYQERADELQEYSIEDQQSFLNAQHGKKDPLGDILVFLPGQDDIETLVQLLENVKKTLPVLAPSLIICPLFASLSPELQQQVFCRTAPYTRKVIVSTNIAETSVTIPNVRFVIDSGLVKQRSIVKASTTRLSALKGSSSASAQAATNRMLMLESLQVAPVSQAQAWQRSGRAGRDGPGVCYRLYTESTFEELEKSTTAEIHRVRLDGVVLQLARIGISMKDLGQTVSQSRKTLSPSSSENSFTDFNFLEPPSPNALRSSLERLFALSAFDKEGKLSQRGDQMASLPLDPMASVALLSSATKYSCAKEVLSIVAMLSVDNLTIAATTTAQRQAQAVAQKSFLSHVGDHITLLNMYHSYEALTSTKAKANWCKRHFFSKRTFLQVENIRRQLEDHLKRMNLDATCSCLNTTNDRGGVLPEYEPIQKSILSGYFLNVAKREAHISADFVDENGRNHHKSNKKSSFNKNGQSNQHKLVFHTICNNEKVCIHPSSSLFQTSTKLGKFVVYNELIMTSKKYMRGLLRVEKEWLTEIAPQYFRKMQK